MHLVRPVASNFPLLASLTVCENGRFLYPTGTASFSQLSFCCCISLFGRKQEYPPALLGMLIALFCSILFDNLFSFQVATLEQLLTILPQYLKFNFCSNIAPLQLFAGPVLLHHQAELQVGSTLWHLLNHSSTKSLLVVFFIGMFKSLFLFCFTLCDWYVKGKFPPITHSLSKPRSGDTPLIFEEIIVIQRVYWIQDNVAFRNDRFMIQKVSTSRANENFNWLTKIKANGATFDDIDKGTSV